MGEWYRIGESYAGEAPIVGYNGGAGGTGSFVTDKWVSTRATYSPSSNYSYTVPAGQTLKALTQAFDQNAIDAFQELLDRAKAMIEDTTYAGTGITIIEEAYTRASKYFTLDENKNPIANPDTLRVWLEPVLSDLDHALIEAQEKIDEILGNRPQG